MGFPQNRDEMVARRYKFSNHSKCKRCGQEMEWWETPNGKKMPFNLMLEPGDPAVTHFNTCVDVERPASDEF